MPLRTSPFLRSPGFDLAFFALPGFLACAVALLVGPRAEAGPVAYLLLVVGVDVSHVYATLHRVYRVPDERRRRPWLYLGLPAAVAFVGVLLAALEPLWFWRVAAYAAVHHFVKQQVGFVSLYRAAAGERAAWTRRLDHAVVYAATLVPVLHWHAHGRRFAWFMKGDFVSGLPVGVMPLAWTAYALLLGAFVSRELLHWGRSGELRLGKVSVVLATAATWFVGIVALDADLAFTVTNVLLHGVAYTALTWHVTAGSPVGSADAPLAGVVKGTAARLASFLGLLLALAWAEELLWDGLVWREHPQLFLGLTAGWDAPHWSMAVATGLLATPQLTHYLLDGFIWCLDGSNPGLRERLFPGLRAPQRGGA